MSPVGASKLNHYRAGKGEPLVLIHGVGATSEIWLPVIPALAERFEIIAVDLPGFGRSAPFADGLRPTIANLADAMEALLDELGLGTVHVAGNSLGGWIALELARRQRARTVVAVAPLGLGTDRENRRTRRRINAAHAMARPLAPIAGPICRPAVGRTLVFGLSTARPWRLEASEAASTLRAFVRTPGFPDTLESGLASRAAGLEEIRCPVTIAWGTRDRILPFGQADRFLEYIAHAEVRALDGLGHVPMSDDPARLAGVILETAS